MVYRSTPTKETLKNIYNTIYKIINNQDCYYTPEEIEKLKKDKSNIFLERGK